MSALEVVGAGLPRTGTLSLRAALELLLGGPCYHGAVPLVERPDHRPAWVSAFAQNSPQPALEAGLLEVKQWSNANPNIAVDDCRVTGLEWTSLLCVGGASWRRPTRPPS